MGFEKGVMCLCVVGMILGGPKRKRKKRGRSPKNKVFNTRNAREFVHKGSNLVKTMSRGWV